VADVAAVDGNSMTTECEILDRAVDCIAEEKQSLQQEREAFETFRESVSRARTTTGDGGTQTGSLLEAYQETVMSTPDFEATYDEPVSESLEAELTPSLADALQQNVPVTQQFKRNLLVGTNTANESRTRYLRVLEAERESLRTVQQTVLDIESTLQKLPSYSARGLQFEQFIDFWESCEHAVDRCDRRSEQRQRHINERQTTDENRNFEANVLNAYLYDSLETQFPALHVLAETRRHIEQCRSEIPGLDSYTGDYNLGASSN
jgi:hypothetical protein